VINLKEVFGRQYRIRWEEAREGQSQDPAYQQIPCRRGTIYAHSDELLAVEVDYHRYVAARVAKIDRVTLHQDGDHEKTFLFPVSLFSAVAAIVMPLRRPQLSPEQRQQSAERMRRLRSHSTQGSTV
jgi:hypothetical protein